MATIGQPLLTPETGWQRIDDNNAKFIYTGSWSDQSLSQQYNSSYHYSTTVGSKISFKFYGTKIRFITDNYANRSALVQYKIDGVIYVVSQYQASGETFRCLNYEKTNLYQGIHSVEITAMESALITGFDAIDIDSTGYLVHPSLNQVSDLTTMPIGSCIPCRYATATSGAYGVFSEFGNCTMNEIPIGGAAIPDGSFNWIFVEYDVQGRMKFIADRNIQTTITFTTLSNAGLVSGSPISFFNYNSPYIFTIKLPTGGTLATDLNNDWDRIIVNSTLNNNITNGSNDIWNWSGIYSWTGTNYNNTTDITMRGNSLVTYINSSIVSNISGVIGFRPELLVQIPTNRYLVQDNNNSSYTYLNGKVVNLGNQIITESLYLTRGMSSILPLNSPQQIIPQQMTSSSNLDSGTMFNFPLKNQHYSSINSVVKE